jgi:hypothetical protein
MSLRLMAAKNCLSASVSALMVLTPASSVFVLGTNVAPRARPDFRAAACTQLSAELKA